MFNLCIYNVWQVDYLLFAESNYNNCKFMHQNTLIKFKKSFIAHEKNKNNAQQPR